MRIGLRTFIIGAFAIALFAAPGFVAGKNESRKIEFTSVKEQTPKFIEYYKTIKLTPEQEKIKTDALSAIPAPCCSDFSIATCCCPCNLAKSIWGLSGYLITEHGYGVEQVRDAAKGWISFVNKSGYSGDTCKTGGCGHAFKDSGCGGMKEDTLVF